MSPRPALTGQLTRIRAPSRPKTPTPSKPLGGSAPRRREAWFRPPDRVPLRFASRRERSTGVGSCALRPAAVPRVQQGDLPPGPGRPLDSDALLLRQLVDQLPKSA